MKKIPVSDNYQGLRLLFLGGGVFFPDAIPTQEKFKALSDGFSGDIIAPVIGSTDVGKIGDYRLTTFTYWKKNSVIRNGYSVISIIILGLMKSWISGRFDAVISPNPLSTGLAGLLISKLTGAKLIIEVNGNFESTFKFGREGQSEITWVDRLKDNLSRALISLNLRHADTVKLVYSQQLAALELEETKIRTIAFPNFVPIGRFLDSKKSDNKYILLIGFPWFLKGVDILIKAFNSISSEFPGYRLKIVGWCPKGREYFQELAKDNPNIDLMDAVEYAQVIELMTGCTLYVLASRTDSSPRVLREAMASKKPIIAANIDGVPDLIKDGYNGFLFESESVIDLASKMRILLSDEDLARKMAENGYKYVQNHLSERVYTDNYKKLIISACNVRDD